MPLVRRTRATFRRAEFGFFGVRVMTCRQTPRLCGAPRPSLVVCLRVFSVRRSAGALTFFTAGLRPLRTSWLMVGNENLVFVSRIDRSCLRSPRRAHGDAAGMPIGVASAEVPLETSAGAHRKASRRRDTDCAVYGPAVRA